MKNSLLVSDLHLSSAPRDAYRFDIFGKMQALARKVDQYWVLGDVTDSKDFHAAKLVNLVCDHIATLAEKAVVHIVKGNHDGTDPEWPYFKFLNKLQNVHFYHEPKKLPSGVLVLPHSRNPDKDWWPWIDTDCKTVMMHTTFKGSLSESGVEIGDVDIPTQLRKRGIQIYSGDVHVPQRLGNVTYIGSPHHVHYGDKFAPRMLWLDDAGMEHSLPLSGMQRLMLDIHRVKDLAKVVHNPGDQAKVRLHLGEEELGKWQELRKQVVATCKEMGLDLAAVELVREVSSRPLLRSKTVAALQPEEVLEEYLQRAKPREAIAMLGHELLTWAQSARGGSA